jgi:hypothetical protein
MREGGGQGGGAQNSTHPELVGHAQDGDEHRGAVHPVGVRVQHLGVHKAEHLVCLFVWAKCGQKVVVRVSSTSLHIQQSTWGWAPGLEENDGGFCSLE